MSSHQQPELGQILTLGNCEQIFACYSRVVHDFRGDKRCLSPSGRTVREKTSILHVQKFGHSLAEGSNEDAVTFLKYLTVVLEDYEFLSLTGLNFILARLTTFFEVTRMDNELVSQFCKSKGQKIKPLDYDVRINGYLVPINLAMPLINYLISCLSSLSTAEARSFLHDHKLLASIGLINPPGGDDRTEQQLLALIPGLVATLDDKGRPEFALDN